uniref:Uncharacterized protein n=1 Tax=Megaselia scalaris TaxID=36166 RepID=T1GFC8_MEGSC
MTSLLGVMDKITWSVDQLFSHIEWHNSCNTGLSCHPEGQNSSPVQGWAFSVIYNDVDVRPFLTRGSVAERVMMFEKCPEIKNPLMRPFNRNQG